MVKLEEQLREVQEREVKILMQINKRNSRRKIGCETCEGFHEIGELVAIQTHWYESPHGCMGGDNWWESDLHYICPETGERNRLLFLSDKDMDDEFRRKYKNLFKEVIDEYEHGGSHNGVNNQYVQEYSKKFGLGED